MDYKYIEQLIERYFDCTTTVAEERILKAFFSQNDVPAHLEQYADLFAYEEEQKEAEMLDEDFDKRIMERLEADGDAPVIHVKIQHLTFADRIRPLFRAAAAVAIVVLIGGSMHRAYVTHTIEPISSFGVGGEEAQGTTVNPAETDNPNLFIQNGEKVAITVDTLGARKKAE